MPRRTNDFQGLITMLTQLLGENAVVEESKMLTDLVSGEQREVDIYAEGTLAGHTVRIGIECRDQKRKQSLGWVEEMHSKHERLPTNLVILVSSSGFTDSAVAKADSYGYKTITPTRADSDLTSEVLASLGNITFTAMLTEWSNVASQATTNIPTEWLERHPHAHGVSLDNGQIQYYRSDGSPLITSDDFNGFVLNQGLTAQQASIDPTQSEFDVEVHVRKALYAGEPLYLYWTADDGEQPILVPVGAIAIRGTAKIATQAITISLSDEISYDGSRFLTGKAPLAEGNEGRVVVTEEVAGEHRWAADLTVHFPPQHSETTADDGS
jgi:hypothetical protein